MEEKKLDKDINVRSKTDLSDEEIVKALENKKEETFEEMDRTGNSLDDYIVGVDGEVIVGATDLIHRLQDENAELKANNATIPEMWDKIEALEADIHSMDREADGYRQTIAEQKAEIERLTKENAALSKGVKRLKKRYEETIKKNADECVKKFCETTMYAEQERLVKENAELQKQVDELKARDISEIRDLFNAETDRLIEKAHKQAVKDTAKEILQDLSDFVDYETFREGYELKKVKEKIKEIAKEKGVEVE